MSEVQVVSQSDASRASSDVWLSPRDDRDQFLESNRRLHRSWASVRSANRARLAMCVNTTRKSAPFSGTEKCTTRGLECRPLRVWDQR